MQSDSKKVTKPSVLILPPVNWRLETNSLMIRPIHQPTFCCCRLWLVRSLAMDQANLVEYSVIQSWVDRLMRARTDEAPVGFTKLSLKQLMAADQKLFMEMADRSRSGVQVTPARRPLDDIVNQCKTLNEVTCLMQPMPAAASKEVQSVKLGSYRETVFKGFRKRGKRQRQEQNCSDVGRLGGLQVSYKLGPANMLWIQPWDLSRNSQKTKK